MSAMAALPGVWTNSGCAVAVGARSTTGARLLSCLFHVGGVAAWAQLAMRSSPASV